MRVGIFVAVTGFGIIHFVDEIDKFNMILPLVLLAAATSSSCLIEPNANQRLGDQPDNDSRAKRHANVQPAWGFLPIFAAPPVIQVHHIVHLQSPDGRCFPSLLPGQQPVPPTQPPVAPNNGGLDNRFGNTNDTMPASNQPSPCVWAIVSCCSPGNRNIRYACFELLGCQGAFWDLSPCEPRVVQAAANTALMFYMTANPVSNQSNVIDFEAQPEPSSTENPATS